MDSSLGLSETKVRLQDAFPPSLCLFHRIEAASILYSNNEQKVNNLCCNLRALVYFKENVRFLSEKYSISNRNIQMCEGILALRRAFLRPLDGALRRKGTRKPIAPRLSAPAIAWKVFANRPVACAPRLFCSYFFACQMCEGIFALRRAFLRPLDGALRRKGTRKPIAPRLSAPAIAWKVFANRPVAYAPWLFCSYFLARQMCEGIFALRRAFLRPLDGAFLYNPCSFFLFYLHPCFLVLYNMVACLG